MSICGSGWLDDLVLTGHDFAEDCFFLGDQPQDLGGDGAVTEEDVRVFVDGAEVSPTTDGAPIWRYVPDWVAVCFEHGRKPGPGSFVEIEYGLACLSR